MNWYYAVNEQRVGPVTDQEMARVVAEGTVTADTLVWKAGMPEWRPWREVGPTANLTPPPPPMPGVEPVASDGAALEEPAHAEAFWAEVRQNGYDLSAGGVLGRAFDLYKTHFGACLGAALLGYLLVGVAGMIPFVSIAAAFLVSPQLNAGVMWNFLRRLRGEDAVIGDLFEPYSRGFGQLALMVLIQIGIALPIIVVMMIMGAGAAFASGVGEGGEVSSLSGAAVLGIVAMGLLLALVMWRLALAPIFIVDRGYTAGAALLLSWRLTGLRLGTFVLLGLALILLSLAGALAFIIGLIFVMPMLPATLVVAYETAGRAARGQPSEAA